MFQPPAGDTPENATGSQANSALFGTLSTPSTERTEPLQGEPQAAVTKPQETVTKPQETVKNPQETVKKPRETILKPQEAQEAVVDNSPDTFRNTNPE